MEDRISKRVSERLEQVLQEKNLQRNELAEMVGVTAQAVTNWIKRGQISPRSARIISDKLGYSVNWLLGAEFEKQNTDIAPIDDSADYSDTHIAIELYDIKLSAGNGRVVEWIPRKSDEPLLFRDAWFKQKRLYPENCKAMYVRGHSMDPVLNDWDTVIVDITDIDIIDGEIYALIYSNNFYIKQVVRTGKGVQLISFNPDYEPIDIMNDDLEDLHIIGRKVWRGG